MPSPSPCRRALKRVVAITIVVILVKKKKCPCLKSKGPSDTPDPDKNLNQDSIKGNLKVQDISKEHSSDEKEYRQNTIVKLKNNKI